MNKYVRECTGYYVTSAYSWGKIESVVHTRGTSTTFLERERERKKKLIFFPFPEREREREGPLFASSLRKQAAKGRKSSQVSVS